MADYSFLLQHRPPPADIPPFYQSGFIVNDYPHLSRQDDGNFYLLSAVNQETRQAEARCAFFIRSDQALSPLAAPFGSVEFAECLSDSTLDKFIAALIDAVRIVGANKIRLVNYPNCYAPRQADQLVSALLQHQFYPVEAHQTSFLSIGPHTFDSQLIAAERRRLRKCRDAGFRVAQWPTPAITDVVGFIQHTRQQQGYRMTIQPDRLVALLRDFPDLFPVFTVTDGANLAALAITVRISQHILYNFLPASAPSYRTFSPTVMLTDGTSLTASSRESRYWI